MVMCAHRLCLRSCICSLIVKKKPLVEHKKKEKMTYLRLETKTCLKPPLLLLLLLLVVPTMAVGRREEGGGRMRSDNVMNLQVQH